MRVWPGVSESAGEGLRGVSECPQAEAAELVEHAPTGAEEGTVSNLESLVREWQEAKRVLNDDYGRSSPEVFEAACDRIDAATTALLAWEPRPCRPAELPPIEVGDIVKYTETDEVYVVEDAWDVEHFDPSQCAAIYRDPLWRRGGGQ